MTLKYEQLNKTIETKIYKMTDELYNQLYKQYEYTEYRDKIKEALKSCEK